MKLYNILRISKDAKKSDIEAAYKKRVKLVHPVINKRGHEEFVELNKAYSILKDNYRREFYDMIGDKSVSLLQNEKSSYVIIRIFDKTNLRLYLLFIIGLLCSLLFLPIGLFFDLQNYHSYLFFSLNLFLVIPLYRNNRRLKLSEFRVIIFISLSYLVITSLFITNNKVIIFLSVLIGLINNISNIQIYTYKNIVMNFIPFVINLSCVFVIKYFPHSGISMILVYCILHLYLLYRPNRIYALLFICILFLYFLPVICINFNIVSIIIFIPLIILILGVIFSIMLLFIVMSSKLEIDVIHTKRPELL